MASDLLQQVTRDVLAGYRRRDEAVLRGLLSRWVSELEPVVIYGRDNMFVIKGLGIADDPTGMIVVPNGDWRPGMIVVPNGDWRPGLMDFLIRPREH